MTEEAGVPQDGKSRGVHARARVSDLDVKRRLGKAAEAGPFTPANEREKKRARVEKAFELLSHAANARKAASVGGGDDTAGDTAGDAAGDAAGCKRAGSGRAACAGAAGGYYSVAVALWRRAEERPAKAEVQLASFEMNSVSAEHVGVRMQSTQAEEVSCKIL